MDISRNVNVLKLGEMISAGWRWQDTEKAQTEPG
jgi:hypothetical protein